jgi:NitT/TauT family transport system substrate-binding protein
LEPGFTGHFFFLALLDEAGLSPSDVEILAMDTGTAGSSFVAGQVDVAVTWEPWIGKTKNLPDTHILVTSKDRPGLIIDVLYMNKNTIDQRTDDVQQLIIAMGNATDWYFHNRDDGDKIIAKFWKLSLEEEKETVAGMEFMTLDENAKFFGTPEKPGQMLTTVTKANDLWLKTNVIKKSIDPRALVDFESVKAAAKTVQSK